MLQPKLPALGWEQILSGRKEMLDGFDKAKQQGRAHEVPVYHGRAGEALFRKWLASFLPKRYGVTSGYIISAGIGNAEAAPHFDVIVYDQMESPVLWVEDSPDASEQGRSLAIPCEYVLAVLEVKSTFSPSTVRKGLDHLKDLSPMCSGIDVPGTYPLHFPPYFCCGLVFFELRQDQDHGKKALAEVVHWDGLRRFFGGIILRAEGAPGQCSGRLSILEGEHPMPAGHAGRYDQVAHTQGPLVKVGDASRSARLSWMEWEFSRFAFDLIAMIQGRYQVGRFSSFHGLGGTGWK